MVCNFLIEQVFLKYGTPQMIHSDCAKCFLSKEFKSLRMSREIPYTMSVPGEHCSNQSIERYFCTLKLNFTKHMAEKGSGWKNSYQLVIFNYNSTSLSLSSVSPNNIIYGYKVVGPNTRKFASENSQAKNIQNVCMNIEKLLSTVIIKNPRNCTNNQSVYSINILNDRNMIVSKFSDARANQIGSLFKYCAPEVHEEQVTGTLVQNFKSL
uniref:Integrase catalytic domain-containing protein n=1 Tax=Strongyloides venezuelensis TaxID=75913 RepID=A0A0K0FFH2_STRVS